MNLHECQLDEFKDEQKFALLSVEQVESWLMVSCKFSICCFARLLVSGLELAEPFKVPLGLVPLMLCRFHRILICTYVPLEMSL